MKSERKENYAHVFVFAHRVTKNGSEVFLQKSSAAMKKPGIGRGERETRGIREIGNSASQKSRQDPSFLFHSASAAIVVLLFFCRTLGLPHFPSPGPSRIHLLFSLLFVFHLLFLLPKSQPPQLGNARTTPTERWE